MVYICTDTAGTFSCPSSLLVSKLLGSALMSHTVFSYLLTFWRCRVFEMQEWNPLAHGLIYCIYRTKGKDRKTSAHTPFIKNGLPRCLILWHACPSALYNHGMRQICIELFLATKGQKSVKTRHLQPLTFPSNQVSDYEAVWGCYLRAH